MLGLLAGQEEEHHAKLRQLDEMQQVQQEKLDYLTKRVHEKEERQRTQMAFVLRDDPVSESDEPGGDERLRTESQQDLSRIHVASRRAKRRTRFCFGRLLVDESLGIGTEVVGAGDGRS